jgi:hypothetical protein
MSEVLQHAPADRGDLPSRGLPGLRGQKQLHMEDIKSFRRFTNKVVKISGR